MDTQGRAYEGLGVGTPVSVGAGSPTAPSSASLQDPLAGGVAFRVGRGIQQLEDVIQHYPWPTVLLGIGVGFLLSRRMR